jgi:hypothetical protein
MQEGSFDVELLEIPAKRCSDMENGAEGLQPSCQGSGFVVVYAVLLGVAFSNVTHFVMDNVAGIITFAFAYEFPLKWVLTFGYGRMGDEDEDVEIAKALQLIASAHDPIFVFRRGNGRGLGGIVITVQDWLKGPISKGR